MLVLASAVNGPDIARTVQIISPVTFKSFIINFVFIKKKLEERKTDGNILAVTVCSTVGVFRIKHLRGCNSATLKMKTAPLSETLVKLTIVQGQPFSDLYPPWETQNLITWLKFFTDILLLIRNSKTVIFEHLHRRRLEAFREKLLYKHRVLVCDSQGCNLLHIGTEQVKFTEKTWDSFFSTRSPYHLFKIQLDLKNCFPTDKTAGARICPVTSF